MTLPRNKPYATMRSKRLDLFKHNDITYDIDAYITPANPGFILKLAPSDLTLSHESMNRNVNKKRFKDFITEKNLMICCLVSGNTRAFVSREFENEIRKQLCLLNVTFSCAREGHDNKFPRVFARSITSISSSIFVHALTKANVSVIYLYNYGCRLPLVDPSLITLARDGHPIEIQDFSPEIKIFNDIVVDNNDMIEVAYCIQLSNI